MNTYRDCDRGCIRQLPTWRCSRTTHPERMSLRWVQINKCVVVCVCVYTPICVYIYIYICILCVCLRVRVCMCIHMHTHMCVCVCACMYVCVFSFVSIKQQNVCMYLCVCVYILSFVSIKNCVDRTCVCFPFNTLLIHYWDLVCVRVCE